MGSGGGGSYTDAVQLLDQLGTLSISVPVQVYKGGVDACVLAMMGSPDVGEKLALTDLQAAISNTLKAYTQATGQGVTCAVPVEIGALNSLVPLIAAIGNPGMWVADGDGAGRAVPQLIETTYSGGAAGLAVSPVVIGNQASAAAEIQSTVLNVATTAQAEALARGIITSSFGSIAGFAGWPSTAANNYALTASIIQGTLSQAWTLGNYMLNSGPLTSQDIANCIQGVTGRTATVVLDNFYITDAVQNTAGGFDVGVVRLDSTATPGAGTVSHHLYNMNESLIMYSSTSTVPDVVAPDSICYYSTATGRGFSNSADDLAQYLNKGVPVSVIQVGAAPTLVAAPGVMAAFAAALLAIGYAGALPGN